MLRPLTYLVHSSASITSTFNLLFLVDEVYRRHVSFTTFTWYRLYLRYGGGTSSAFAYNDCGGVNNTFNLGFTPKPKPLFSFSDFVQFCLFAVIHSVMSFAVIFFGDVSVGVFQSCCFVFHFRVFTPIPFSSQYG